MLRKMILSRKKSSGFSLIEIIVVLLIISVLGAVAVPLYVNEKSRSYLAAAISDSNLLGVEVAQSLADYTSLGTGTGTITISGGVLVFSAMTGATGAGNVSATGPGTTTTVVQVSANSVIGSSNWSTSGGVHWCLEVTNLGTYAKITDAGPGVSGIGTPSGSNLCVAGA